MVYYATLIRSNSLQIVKYDFDQNYATCQYQTSKDLKNWNKKGFP